MVIDLTTQMIYGMSEREDMNGWLKTLAQIRAWPQTGPALKRPKLDA